MGARTGDRGDQRGYKPSYEEKGTKLVDVRELPWWTPEDQAALDLVAWAILELFESEASSADKERLINLAHDWVAKREAQARYLHFRTLARDAWIAGEPPIHHDGVLGYSA